MATEKLFYSNPSVYEWETDITGMEMKDNLWHVTLKRTNFYPEGGGQPCDLGFIDGKEVIDVQKSGEEVIHILKEKPEKQTVFCQIDKIRRIEHTQHHTCQHLLSAVCLSLYHAETSSFHLSDDTATIDLDVPSLSTEELVNIEERVNEYILQNRRIHIFFLDEKDLSKYPLGKIPEGINRYRIVEIEGVEYNACGGTHVQSTAEIGWMKILKTEKNRGKVRLYFVCGLRLFRDYQRKHEILVRLAKDLGTAVQSIDQSIEKLKVEKKEAENKFQRLFTDYTDLLVKEWKMDRTDSFVSVIFDQLTVKELNVLAAKWFAKGGEIALFASRSEGKMLFAHNGKVPIHCGNIIKEIASLFSGKGGGDNKRAQAVFPDPDVLDEATLRTEREIKKLLNKE